MSRRKDTPQSVISEDSCDGMYDELKKDPEEENQFDSVLEQKEKMLAEYQERTRLLKKNKEAIRQIYNTLRIKNKKDVEYLKELRTRADIATQDGITIEATIADKRFKKNKAILITREKETIEALKNVDLLTKDIEYYIRASRSINIMEATYGEPSQYLAKINLSINVNNEVFVYEIRGKGRSKKHYVPLEKKDIFYYKQKPVTSQWGIDKMPSLIQTTQTSITAIESGNKRRSKNHNLIGMDSKQLEEKAQEVARAMIGESSINPNPNEGKDDSSVCSIEKFLDAKGEEVKDAMTAMKKYKKEDTPQSNLSSVDYQLADDLFSAEEKEQIDRMDLSD